MFSCSETIVIPDSEKIKGNWTIEYFNYNGSELLYSEFCQIFDHIKLYDYNYDGEFDYYYSNMIFTDNSVNTLTICSEINNTMNWSIKKDTITIDNMKYKYEVTHNTLSLKLIKTSYTKYEILFKKM